MAKFQEDTLRKIMRDQCERRPPDKEPITNPLFVRELEHFFGGVEAIARIVVSYVFLDFTVYQVHSTFTIYII